MLNHIVLMGRLTADPVIRYTQSNTPVASFRLAVDRDYSKDQEKKTDFIDCVAWRGMAEFVQRYFFKGTSAVASGRLQIRDWTDREGQRRSAAEVVCEHIYFGESKQRGDRRTTEVPEGAVGGAFSELDDGDEELPF